MARKQRLSDEELIALTAEYAERRTYQPGDDTPEPDQAPQGASGTSANATDPSSSDS